jgi:His-Xaa-Ser repeat-associated downstream radical SAM protein
MVKGDRYRPLVINGTSMNRIDYCMGVLVVDEDTTDRNNKIQVLYSDHTDNFSEGYDGYLFEDRDVDTGIKEYLDKAGKPYLLHVNNIDTVCSKDIVEIYPNHTVKILFRANSDDNALVVTNQCNCNCVMCPEPAAVRDNGAVSIEKIIKTIHLVDSLPKYLCITGGEPTILKEKLFDILDSCSERLPYTNFMLLTNARMFSYMSYTLEFNEHRPQYLTMGIPLYGSTPGIHDRITNTSGSFVQTVAGIKNLIRTGNSIELRVVVSKLNCDGLQLLSDFIICNFPNVARVSIMALEMLGNAIINKDDTWIGFDDLKEPVKQMAIKLIQNGIETYLFNFPLCFVDETLWSITLKSISDYKIRYFDECEKCAVKEKCGGFFNSTINIKELDVKPYRGEK